MTPHLSEPELRALITGFGDHQKFCKESLRIRAKSGAMLPFELQPAQIKLNKAILKQRAMGVPVRICYLKAGQVMVSSGTAAQNFHAVPFMPGRHCLALADSEDHAQLVFQYYKTFQQEFVPFTGGGKGAIGLPELVNDKSETLKWANDSFIRCATGRNVHVGRSNPYQFVQVSEFGFMDGGATLMDGLMQRVPRTPETMVIVESTGFGEGGPFYELCQRAQNPQTAGGWLFVFFAGYEHPEYRMKVEDPHLFAKDLSPEERSEKAQYGLTLEYLNWRRWCIANNCGGRVSVFRQEFPNNPREAFQGSTRTYLDMGAVERCCQIEEPMRGELEVFQVGPEKRVQFQQKEQGFLAIYRKPKKFGRYVIGADSAEGRDEEAKKGGRSNPDYAAADVTDADTGEQVAVYHGRITESHFARVVHALGWYYNWAYLVPEAVGAGRAFLQALLALDYPTDRIYKKERPAGDTRPPQFNEMGFHTTTLSRRQLLGGLDTAFLEGVLTIHDQQTAQECRTLVSDPDGYVAAKLGAHDDLVFAKALAVVGLRVAPLAKLPGEMDFRPMKYGQGAQRDDD